MPTVAGHRVGKAGAKLHVSHTDDGNPIKEAITAAFQDLHYHKV